MADEDSTKGEWMSRREVAYRFAVASVTVKNWSRSQKVALTEFKDDDGKPRYKRSEVEALYATGFVGLAQKSDYSKLRRM
jgi:transposase